MSPCVGSSNIIIDGLTTSSSAIDNFLRSALLNPYVHESPINISATSINSNSYIILSTRSYDATFTRVNKLNAINSLGVNTSGNILHSGIYDILFNY